jgi:hypothetical protein
VAFTEIITIHQIHHTWIYAISHSHLSPLPHSWKTFNIFPFILQWLCLNPSFFLNLSKFCSFLNKNNLIGMYLYMCFHCDISIHAYNVLWSFFMAHFTFSLLYDSFSDLYLLLSLSLWNYLVTIPYAVQ